MTGPGARRGFDWEAAGYELGESLDGYNALAVIGLDPVTTGRAAVGIARAQSGKRRVAIGDLFAESPPIQELVTSDDPHGLVDSFLYGVSLSKIAHPVADAGDLYVMPSGTEAPSYDEILPNPRWHRLTAGFREVGALLVLALPANAPHIEDLVAATDGAILVGDAVPRKLPIATVIASVREPKAAEEMPLIPTRKTAKGRNRARSFAALGVALAIVLAALGLWLAYRPLAGTRDPRRVKLRADTAKRPLTAIAPAPPRTDSMTDSTLGPALAIPRVVNPGDSAQSAAFGVQLMAANTQAGAILKLQQDGANLPSETFAPVLIQGAEWYKVIAGAYAAKGSADSLLAALGRRQQLLGGESVVRLPFAFLIDTVPPTAVPEVLKAYAEKGQPVYALRQANGMAWLLAGAFESPEESALYAESLRASGITPALVYRKGRTF